MKDQNGRPLAVGDAVRIFCYYLGKIVAIQAGASGEMAVVETRTGTNVVYPEEIRRAAAAVLAGRFSRYD
ncbi:MAG: hypothetical protein NTY23_11345 [Chloroflexi bacterium]|nr:hypothetical protein [Chloroflexota bacterium]